MHMDGGADARFTLNQASEKGITIGPGRLFSCANQFGHFMRLTESYPWSRKLVPGCWFRDHRIGKDAGRWPRP